MTDERTTPYGMWRYGNDFLLAAIDANRGDRIFMPYYFLVGQSIELFLKAFLMGRGVDIQVLKKAYGHNLEKLLTEARQQGLDQHVELENVHFGVIALLGYEYLQKRFQYIRTGTVYLPDIVPVQEAANRLARGLEAYCKHAAGLT